MTYMRDGRHFKLIEFACPLTQQIVVNIALVEYLDELRFKMQRAMWITSGYRSSRHNEAVGGAKNSQHLLGNAADTPIQGPADGLKMIELAKGIGFTGIGLYPSKGFAHLDVRPGPGASWGEIDGRTCSLAEAEAYLARRLVNAHERP